MTTVRCHRTTVLAMLGAVLSLIGCERDSAVREGKALAAVRSIETPSAKTPSVGAQSAGAHPILTGNDNDYSVTQQAGTNVQFDVSVDFNGGSVQRDLDQPIMLNGQIVPIVQAVDGTALRMGPHPTPVACAPRRC